MNAPATLHQAGQVVIGAGSLGQLPQLLRGLRTGRALLVVSRSVRRAGLLDAVLAGLDAAGIGHVIVDDTPAEPDVQDVERTLAASKAAGACDAVVGIGGGSVIDVAKIAAVVLAHDVSLRDLLAKRVPVPGRGLPTVMVPTTAGTGAEATPNAIVLVAEDALKVGIVDPHLVPDAVILDAQLTLTLPPEVTASTGMDALTHAIECVCSRKGNTFSELYGLEAIRLIGRSIRRAVADGHDAKAREDMLLGAYYGGVCIATSSTTAVHALAYPLGGTYRMAHGLSNAILLPSVMAYNRIGQQARFAAMARAMGVPVEGLDDEAASRAFVDALRQLNADLGVPADLRGLGIGAADLDALVDGAAKVTRLLDNNPRPMTRDDLRAIYAELI
ncbi:iron-containing alcohol dehydrogenase [Leptothrix discophora]|uniref:Iron-containing alcohol dehydrogenase n=1 Tax=Leptothrix discophora TaxID=89 RepID=A0ABT9FZ67_LEPDI|nr:iron-containing alcohol dehydrogenase [Leptothrix discophora]MDP4299327.1 iron-containing alcohol dehydrogenase [Leptothrix discophora]